MRKCWNCGQPTNNDNSRVCSDEICQRAEKKSSNGEFIVRTTTVNNSEKRAAAKAAKSATKAAAKAAAKGSESRERMKKAMQDLGMTKELKLYFGEE